MLSQWKRQKGWEIAHAQMKALSMNAEDCCIWGYILDSVMRAAACRIAHKRLPFVSHLRRAQGDWRSKQASNPTKVHVDPLTPASSATQKPQPQLPVRYDGSALPLIDDGLTRVSQVRSEFDATCCAMLSTPTLHLLGISNSSIIK